MPTIHALVAQARRRLVDAGIPGSEAELDARLLVDHLLGWDAARYFAHGDEAADGDLVTRYTAAIERRVRREPVAYITGVQEFWGLSFEVTPAVLIPRPETELVIEAGLAHVGTRRPLRVADVCTGSGCLAVSLAVELPDATVTAADISTGALAVAARNVARHHVGERVTLQATDLLADVDGPFDLIVSNPPYVAETERATLPQEVVEHEPLVALFAGADGLALIRRLVSQAASRLAPGGLLVFEFGFGQAEAIARLLHATPRLSLVELRDDLQRIPRVAVARAAGRSTPGPPAVTTGGS